VIKSLTDSGAREKLSIQYYAVLAAESLARFALVVIKCRAQWQYKLIITTLRMIDATYLMRTVRSRGLSASILTRPPPINSEPSPPLPNEDRSKIDNKNVTETPEGT
jgi:hypothetical protein